MAARPMAPDAARTRPPRKEDRPIRVALYAKGFPPTETGGPVRVAYNLAQEYLRSGRVRMTLVVQTDAEEDEIRRALGGPPDLTVVRLGYFPSLGDLRAIRKVVRAFRDADVIHFNEFPIRQLAYVILAKARGVPTVFSLHGLLTREAATFLGPSYPVRLVSGEREAAVRAPHLLVAAFVRLYRWIAPRWTAVVANSQAQMERAAVLENFDPSRMRLIPNGVEISDRPAEKAEERSGSARLLFVGKLEHVKGPDLLLGALEELAAAGVCADVAVAGAGSLDDELRARAEGLAGHRVRFLGSVPHEDVARLYAWADIVVVPSRYESFGIVVLEAMAAGRPLVATAVGGIPEIVSSPRNAILVAPEPRAIATGLRMLIERPDLRASMAAANREDVATYEWSAIAPQYVSLYRELVLGPAA